MSAVLANECRSPECLDVAGSCRRKAFCSGLVIQFPAALATPKCLSDFPSLTHKLWGDGHPKHITLFDRTDLIYGIRMWEEARKRWLVIEAQKLTQKHFREAGDVAERLCHRYARVGFFSFHHRSECQLEGADIIALTGDIRYGPTELDIFGWEALQLGYLRHERVPSNWRSSDMTMSYVRSQLA